MPDLVPRMWRAARARGVDAPDWSGTTPPNDCALPPDRYRALLAERAAARTIFVCENPAVLRAAAGELQDTGAALVCTEGVPSAACHKLLDDAVRAGARLHWRADFDWAGPRITAGAVARHGAHPWRMTAADYTAALGRSPHSRPPLISSAAARSAQAGQPDWSAGTTDGGRASTAR
ncbi:DUF2399 domain-containing protein [Streptomyces sp. NPDC001796]|uniref:DUF2399 domain-containing protein n=1 Tax=Streptomyces sp. NPDC001796 TaxID=3364609 RepID=UPI0036C61B7F